MFHKTSMKFNNILSSLQILQKHVKYSTIYALSSGYGKCGVAVIRISGNNSGEALKIMTRTKELPTPRFALLKSIYHPKSKEILDKGLVLWFPGPRSFTGEDCCEFQVHGGLAVISSILNSLQNIPKLRPAEPGEFTRRAFNNGKLDLTEVEGLSDLLQAETEMQRRQAFLQTDGVLKNLYNHWRTILVKSVANVEAHIDFEETESIEHNLLTSTFTPIEGLYTDMQTHLQNGRKGEILRNGIKTVLIGEPNVGKSSLFNILCQRPAAIVTPTPGTTRDVLETTLDINGYPLVLIDTAGLRQSTSDLIEEEGIKRAINSVKDANLIFLVVDVSKFSRIHEKYKTDFTQYLTDSIKEMGLSDFFLLDSQNENRKCIVVANKSDLLKTNFTTIINRNIVLMSCTTKDGFQTFIEMLTVCLKELCGTPSKEHPCMSKERHRFLILSCLGCLERFLEACKEENKDVVILAQYLRSALRQIGKLSGNITTEDLLDVIFKDFCIGK